MKRLFFAFCTFVLAFALFFSLGAVVDAKQSGPGKIDCLVCNPGEDCSTELRFAWKSTEPNCYFYFTTATDTNFKNARKELVSGVANNTAYTNISSDTPVEINIYTYEFEVNNLVPGTKYLYKVSTIKNEATSGVHNATTATLTGSFNFIWVGDDHLTCASWSKRTTFTNNMLKQAVNQISAAGAGETNLIVSTGDTVSYGSYYDDHLEWNEDYAFTNFVFADSPGNHDYYERWSTYNASSGSSSSKMTTYPLSWEAARNMPDNGFASYSALGYKSTYYFIYNSCLFISLDSIASHDNHAEQEKWLIDTVKGLEGQYQWLIVYEHYPFFDGETAAETHYTGSCFANWWKAFDEIGVDLALSGDSHVYLRSKPLKNRQVDEDGTVYMTCPQVGDRYRYIEERQNDSWMEVRIGSKTGDYGLQDNSGLGYIMVTPEKLTYKLIDTTYQVKDSFSIYSKRSLPAVILEKQKVQDEILASSFELLGRNGSDHESLVFDLSRVNYLKSLEVKLGNETLVNTNTFDSANIDLGNLEDNKVHELDVNIKFVDGTQKSIKVYGSTYLPYGTIGNFKVNVVDGKTVLSWEANTTDLIAKYEVFEGNTSLGTSTSTSLALDSKKPVDTVYTLKAYTTNNELIFSQDATYKLYGDINYDGAINDGDCANIFASVFGNATLTDEGKLFGDLNNDGKVDFADATIIMLYQSGKVTKTYHEKYTVAFKDEMGLDLVTVKVIYGDDAQAPTPAQKDGYTFVGWSKPITNVTSDLVVYAIYQKNN